MMPIEIKSTGTLYDELITADLKLQYKPNDRRVQQRRHDLANAITRRLFMKSGSYDTEKFTIVLDGLKAILRACWDAQEVVMEEDQKEMDINFTRVAIAAIEAQHTNATRNKLIQELDEILGEKDQTHLWKTYAR